jgi:DNA-binding SARP family transcriptional activator
VRELVGAQVALIEAPGGFGKSVLATELRDGLGIASAEAVLDPGTRSGDVLLGALRRGLRRAGLSDSAAALTGSGAADLVHALDRGPPESLLVVEEAQRASGEAAALLAAVARGLPGGRRLLVVGRRMEPELARLEGAVRLGPEELAFDEAELAALLRGVTGEEPPGARVAEVSRLTFGWPAATALAAARLERNPDAPLAGGGGGSALPELLDDLLAPLEEEDRRRICRLAHLPLLDEDTATAAAGPGALALVERAGLPLRATGSGWRELADPVREELASRHPLPADAARAGAEAYADAGDLPAALSLLTRLPDPEGVAGLLAGRRWQELAALDLAELRAILTTLDEGAIASHPFALVQVARLAEQQLDHALGDELLASALAAMADGEGRREVEAEAIAARAMTDPGDEVEREATELLGRAAAGEVRARARALTALGRVAAWRGEPAAMLEAERLLGEAVALCRLVGETEWEARTLTGLGYRVSFARGDLRGAIEQMGAALALLPEPDRERAAVATFLAEALAFAGHLDDAEATLREAAEIGRRLGDHRIQAYAAWTGTTAASLRGDAAATQRRIRTAELHPGGWFEHPTGIEFLADAALALARVGLREEADAYATRAAERADAAGHPEIGWIATGAVAARWGDPAEAEQALAAYGGSPQQAPRDEWRTLLLRALAADRGGDAAAAASLAAQAFEGAAELGQPELPGLHEPDVVAALGSAADRVPRSAEASGPGFAITVLGGFAVASGGRQLEVPAGRPSTLVKLLAVSDGPLEAVAAIEELWPEVAEATGRSRLRNLLNRLRAACGELVVRDGGTLTLAPCEIDARAFEEAAGAAMRAAPEARAGLARRALARHGGELLPGDRYAPWAAAPRERVQRRRLELLDLLAEDAVERGDVDEAIRLLDEAQAAQPLDEDRYLRAAELLLFQGRRGSARALVERAAALTAELGIEDSPQLTRLRAATGGA